MTAPDYGRSFAHWRGSGSKDWQGYTPMNPFVEGLATALCRAGCFGELLDPRLMFSCGISARAWSMAVV